MLNRVMPKLENVLLLSDKVFRRIVGVKKSTFEEMIKILTEEDKIKKSKGGRPSKLSIEEKLLMTLEYLREYRTYAAIAVSYGISESNTYENIKWVEDMFIKCGRFSLPGKKALLNNTDNEFEVILIDASESPIERPKKNKKIIILEKKSDIH